MKMLFCVKVVTPNIDIKFLQGSSGRPHKINVNVCRGTSHDISVGRRSPQGIMLFRQGEPDNEVCRTFRLRKRGLEHARDRERLKKDIHYLGSEGEPTGASDMDRRRKLGSE